MTKLNVDKRNKINSLLFILFLFADILTFPLVLVTGDSKIFWGFLIVIFVFSLLINQLIKNKLIFIFATGTIIFMINVLLVSYKSDVLYEYMLFIRVGILSLYFSSLIKEYKFLIKYYYVMSLIGLVISNFNLSFYEDTNGYMDLGINLTYIFIGLSISFYNKSSKYKIFTYLLLVIVLLETLILANRSALIICISIIVYFELFKLKFNKKGIAIMQLKITITFLSMYLIIYNINSFLKILNTFALKMGVSSYSLTKLTLTIQEGVGGIVEQSSGRDVLYPLLKELIMDSNLLPHGVSYLPYITNYAYVYPHNLFLEIALDFGLIGLIGWCLMMVVLTKKFLNISKNDDIARDIIVIFSVSGFIRLMFSGSYWQEPLFWIPIGIVMFYNSSNLKVHNNRLNL
ncbi:oligosaccharide repeat unit polymerase [Bacillus sp. H8-1]|nr:oligosaccharide repeat unit polymerase [Bacillus sp. H8-1]